MSIVALVLVIGAWSPPGTWALDCEPVPAIRSVARRMAPRLAEGSSFIAIGALHLAGERGVLALLEGLGYRASRVY